MKSFGLFQPEAKGGQGPDRKIDRVQILEKLLRRVVRDVASRPVYDFISMHMQLLFEERDGLAMLSDDFGHELTIELVVREQGKPLKGVAMVWSHRDIPGVAVNTLGSPTDLRD